MTNLLRQSASPKILAYFDRPTTSDGFAITCGSCKHNADIDEFSKTPITGELPTGEYQCPKCATAIRQEYGEITTINARL